MQTVVMIKENEVAYKHILACALDHSFKFQNFNLKLWGILPHCIKVMIPQSYIIKIGELFGDNKIK